MEQVISEALRVARSGYDVNLPGDSSCYELRLHEGNGEPDLDLSACL